MNFDNKKVEDYVKKIDDSVPGLSVLREAEISNQARDIFFSSTLGKVYSLVMATSVPASTLIFWLVLDFNIVISIGLGLVFFYFVIYLFIYSLLITPIEKRLTEINNKHIADSLKEASNVTGVGLEEMMNSSKK